MVPKPFSTAAQGATLFSSKVTELEQAPQRSRLNTLYSVGQGAASPLLGGRTQGISGVGSHRQVSVTTTGLCTEYSLQGRQAQMMEKQVGVATFQKNLIYGLCSLNFISCSQVTKFF